MSKEYYSDTIFSNDDLSDYIPVCGFNSSKPIKGDVKLYVNFDDDSIYIQNDDEDCMLEEYFMDIPKDDTVNTMFNFNLIELILTNPNNIDGNYKIIFNSGISEKLPHTIMINYDYYLKISCGKFPCNGIFGKIFEYSQNLNIIVSSFKSNDIPVSINEKIDETQLGIKRYLKKKYSMKMHQRNNLLWAIDIENTSILKNAGIIENYDVTGYNIIKFGYSDPNKGNFYLYQNVKNRRIINEQKFMETNKDSIQKFKLYGGILADEVGLGKTLSMTSLIISRPGRKFKLISDKKKSKKIDRSGYTPISNIKIDDKEYMKSSATLVICPSRLCSQWETEHMKFLQTDKYDFRLLQLRTIKDYNKYTDDDYCNADIIYVSFKFLTNANYKKAERKITDFYWHRVIIDEGHEILVNGELKKADDRLKRDTVLQTKSKFRWVCTGTPFPKERDSLSGILQFISNNEFKNKFIDNFKKVTYNKILSQYTRFNTKESTKGDVFVPKIIQETKFLKQSPEERAIYLNAQGDEKRQIQLCTHVLVSELDANIIGANGEAVSLEQVHKLMTKHTKKNLDESQNKLKIQEKKLVETENEETIRLKEFINNEEPGLGDIDEDDMSESEKKKLSIIKKKEIYKDMKQIFSSRKSTIKQRIKNLKDQIRDNTRKHELFTNLDQHVKDITEQECPICLDDDIEIVSMGICGHAFCAECIDDLFSTNASVKCPVCRCDLRKSDIKTIDTTKVDNSLKNKDTEEVININKWGTKMAYLIKYIKEVSTENDTNRIIIFSQFATMLGLVGGVLKESGIKHVYVKGNVYSIANSMRKFKTDPTIRVIMLSSETCSSGSNLTEASHIVLLDTASTEAENAKAIESQAIGRAARMGQDRNVLVTRLIMHDTIEEEHYKRNYLDGIDYEDKIDDIAIAKIRKCRELEKDGKFDDVKKMKKLKDKKEKETEKEKEAIDRNDIKNDVETKPKRRRKKVDIDEAVIEVAKKSATKKKTKVTKKKTGKKVKNADTLDEVVKKASPKTKKTTTKRITKKKTVKKTSKNDDKLRRLLEDDSDSDNEPVPKPKRKIKRKTKVQSDSDNEKTSSLSQQE